jgi:uncharacterized protein (DUF2141 family)
VFYHSVNPFFFTTGSKVQSEINEEVNFGVAVSLARLFGVVRNDAGNGVPGIEVSLSIGLRMFRATTDSEGKFRVEGLSPGSYRVQIDTDSVPPGYSLAGLTTQQAAVDPSLPVQIAFTLTAIRNISGHISTYDRASRREIPMASIKVFLRGTSLESVTDENGTYLFRGLPAGAYHLSVFYNEKEFDREVILPAGPVFHKDIDFDLVTERAR